MNLVGLEVSVGFNKVNRSDQQQVKNNKALLAQLDFTKAVSDSRLVKDKELVAQVMETLQIYIVDRVRVYKCTCAQVICEGPLCLNKKIF